MLQIKLGYATGSSIPTKWPCNSNAEDNYNKNSNDDKFKPKQVRPVSKIQVREKTVPTYEEKGKWSLKLFADNIGWIGKCY